MQITFSETVATALNIALECCSGLDEASTNADQMQLLRDAVSTRRDGKYYILRLSNPYCIRDGNENRSDLQSLGVSPVAAFQFVAMLIAEIQANGYICGYHENALFNANPAEYDAVFTLPKT